MTETELALEPILEHQFDDVEQQQDATNLGMWAFLATEVMFFGGLFTAYIVFRTRYSVGFGDASQHLNVTLGGINTAVLLGSSLSMALAVRAVQLGMRKSAVGYLVATMLLGAGFLGIKAVEYYQEFQEHLIPGLNLALELRRVEGFELFFILYFFMTGLHAFHLIVGIVLVGIIAVLLARNWFSGGGVSHVEVTGLYWHFIDIVWVFLYPLLYLMDLPR